jgi:hypothetical protein
MLCIYVGYLCIITISYTNPCLVYLVFVHVLSILPLPLVYGIIQPTVMSCYVAAMAGTSICTYIGISFSSVLIDPIWRHLCRKHALSWHRHLSVWPSPLNIGNGFESCHVQPTHQWCALLMEEPSSSPSSAHSICMQFRRCYLQWSHQLL